MFDIDVPAGVEFLVAEVQAMSAELADADLYLFDCTGNPCRLVRAGRGYSSSERVAVQHPKPGGWRVMLDSSASAAAPIRYRYTDLYTVAEAGALSVIDPSIDRAAGSSWQARVRPWLAGVIESERHPAAMLFVHDPVRTSRLEPETFTEAYGCKTFPYCGIDRRESALLGLTLVDFAVAGDGNIANTALSP
jgi:hypothetical protein